MPFNALPASPAFQRPTIAANASDKTNESKHFAYFYLKMQCIFVCGTTVTIERPCAFSRSLAPQRYSYYNSVDISPGTAY
jgi:hypothetical protein